MSGDWRLDRVTPIASGAEYFITLSIAIRNRKIEKSKEKQLKIKVILSIYNTIYDI